MLKNQTVKSTNNAAVKRAIFAKSSGQKSSSGSGNGSKTNSNDRRTKTLVRQNAIDKGKHY